MSEIPSPEEYEHFILPTDKQAFDFFSRLALVRGVEVTGRRTQDEPLSFVIDATVLPPPLLSRLQEVVYVPPRSHPDGSIDGDYVSIAYPFDDDGIEKVIQYCTDATGHEVRAEVYYNTIGPTTDVLRYRPPKQELSDAEQLALLEMDRTPGPDDKRNVGFIMTQLRKQLGLEY